MSENRAVVARSRSNNKCDMDEESSDEDDEKKIGQSPDDEEDDYYDEEFHPWQQSVNHGRTVNVLKQPLLRAAGGACSGTVVSVNGGGAGGAGGAVPNGNTKVKSAVNFFNQLQKHCGGNGCGSGGGGVRATSEQRRRLKGMVVRRKWNESVVVSSTTGKEAEVWHRNEIAFDKPSTPINGRGNGIDKAVVVVQNVTQCGGHGGKLPRRSADNNAGSLLLVNRQEHRDSIKNRTVVMVVTDDNHKSQEQAEKEQQEDTPKTWENMSNRKPPTIKDNSTIRSDAFLEPYFHGLAAPDRHISVVDTVSPAISNSSPPPASNAALMSSSTTTTSRADNKALRLSPVSVVAPNSITTLEATTPASPPTSRSPSGGSILSSNGGGSDAGSEDSGETGYGTSCDMSLMERLIRSHPIWFLPGIQRAGAFHLLQGKEEGCFVVRQSSQNSTMALSVRLPPDKGPYIEHYLIQSNGGRLGLETSENRFDNMPALVAHYANCCDELPVQLTLPRAVLEAKSRQQLSSLALLGQEFWRYSLPQSNASSPDADLILNLNPLLTTFKTAEPATPIDTLNNNTNTNTNRSGSSNGKATRPNTLNLLNNNSPAEKSPPPPPPPRWSKPTTPQTTATFATVTTTVSINVNSTCDISSNAYKTNSPSTESNNILSPNSSVTDPSSSATTTTTILSPDTLSPLSVTRTGRNSSKRNRHKLSKHYQESDIIDSPTVLYYRSGLGDKISDYEDVWTTNTEAVPQQKCASTSDNLPSPDLLQHTPTNENTNATNSSKLTSNSNSTQTTPPKHGSPFYAEPADSLAAAQKRHHPLRRNINVTASQHPHLALNRNAQHRHSNPTGLLSPSTADRANEWSDAAPLIASGSVDNLSPHGKYLHRQHQNSQAQQQLYMGKILRRPDLKPVMPPLVKPKLPPNDSWQIDNGWKFLTNDCDMNTMDSSEPDYDSEWPTIPNVLSSLQPYTSGEDDDFHSTNSIRHGSAVVNHSSATSGNSTPVTVQELIAKRFPHLHQPTSYPYHILDNNNADDHEPSNHFLSNFEASHQNHQDHLDEDSMCRMSSYDNVHLRLDELDLPQAPPSEISELTEFSDPWTEISPGMMGSTDIEECAMETKPLPTTVPTASRHQKSIAAVNRSKSFKERLDPLLSPPRLRALRNREQNGGQAMVGAAIRNYTLELARDHTTTFAQNIENFIACTCESKETNPQIIMRNMRQFMSGMKNYLVKHGERGFYREIERERSKLKPTEFLNLDAILEGVMHRLVVKPLKTHLHKLFLDHYTKSGDIRLLADNIYYAATRPIAELAIKPAIPLPDANSLATIQHYLQCLQSSDSPLEKLEYLLAAIATIFNSVKSGQLTAIGALGSAATIDANGSNANTGTGSSSLSSSTSPSTHATETLMSTGLSNGTNGSRLMVHQLGADDFLPLFVWVLVKTNFVAAEIEAEYMWGLLHPSLLSGEGGYYLTTLSSAVHVLKNFKDTNTNGSEESVKRRLNSDSVLKVVVPDELHGSILTKTLPARPNMTTKEVCKIIAHKARITNPQDYALYRLTDGEETMLMDNECPQDFVNQGKHTMLAYKRIEAKIAWPNQEKLNV